MSSCPECYREVTANQKRCQCGAWLSTRIDDGQPAQVEQAPPQQIVKKSGCCFEGDGKCAGPASIRIGDYFMCRGHYENGYDAVFVNGKPVPVEQRLENLRHNRGNVR